MSIFSMTSEDAARVLAVVEGYDAEDPYSRRLADYPIEGRRFGVPRGDQLQFFGDGEYARLFDQALARVESLGGSLVRIDFAPFLEAGRLLYEGPWVAERYAAVGDFIHENPSAVHPVTRQVIESGNSPGGVEVFKAQYQLMSLRRAIEKVWESVDVIMTPTAGTIYERARVDADPIHLNATLGYYTNCMNLLDLAGVAIPAGFRNDGLPFGVTLIGRCATDHALLALAGRLHRASVDRLGAVNWPMPEPAVNTCAAPVNTCAAPVDFTALAVCGAHMDGLALNRQLRDRGGYLLQSTRTAASYRLFALSGGPPRRPGLVRVMSGGASIDVEVWAVRTAEFGSLVEAIPAPLGIGTIELEGGELVRGFLCESYAADGAVDITELGGWRTYLR